MALAEDLSRLMGYGQGPDNNAEIQFKIKPLGNVANVVSPQAQQVSPTSGQAPTLLNQPSSPTLTAGGIGEGQGGSPGATPTAPTPGQVGANPTLVPHPSGGMPIITPPGQLTPPGNIPAPPGGGDEASILSSIRQSLGLPDLSSDEVPPGGPPSGPFNQPPQANMIAGELVTGQPVAAVAGPEVPTGPTTTLPPNMQVRRTPLNLPTSHPLGAQTDDIYEAAVAQLQFDTQSRYAQLLQELGFIGDDGTFMPGTLETDALRQRGDIGDQRRLALEQVLNDAARGNTVFSGRRATNEANTQRPYDSALANLETTLGRELAGRYQSLGDLSRQFELGRNQLVAEAAERIAANNRPTGDGDGGGPAGDGGAATAPGGSISEQVDAWINSQMNSAASASGPAGSNRPPNTSLVNVGSTVYGNRAVAPPNVTGVKYVVYSNTGIQIGYIDPATNRFVKWSPPRSQPASSASGGGGRARVM